MKTYLMELKVKDSIIELALAASKAYKAYSAALKELAKVKTAESLAKMDTLLTAKTETFQVLIDAITNLTPDMVNELANQGQYQVLHKPLFPKEGGKMGWNPERGDEITDALKSIQSALEGDGGQFKGNQDRIHRMRSRVISASAVVVLCRETGIVPPKDGLDRDFADEGLRKLNAKIQELYKAGNQKWEKLSGTYKFVKNALSYLKPREQRNARPASRPTQPKVSAAADVNPAAFDPAEATLGKLVGATEASSQPPETPQPKSKDKGKRPERKGRR